MRKVLLAAEEYDLRIELKKCQFLMSKVNFLGYVVEDSIIRPSAGKLPYHEGGPFKQLKECMMTAPVLNLYNPNAITELHTDAYMYGYGGVLLHKSADDHFLHPVKYMSHKTTDAQKKYHFCELEMLAIIGALKSGEFILWIVR